MFKKNKECPIQSQDFSQHIIRHTMILKDIAQSCDSCHPSMIKSRLNESAQLLSKKFSILLSGNFDDYHDYIQDFYDSQMDTLRNEVHAFQSQIRAKERMIEELEQENRILQENCKISFQQPIENNFEEKLKLKKEVDHCRLLLKENNDLIEEQNIIISELSQKLTTKEEKINKYRKQYENKVLLLDEMIKSNTQKFNRQWRNVESESREMNQQIKEYSITTLRAVEEKQMVEKQFYLKMEEIKLLTKKVYESSLLAAKLERQLSVKESVIEELHSEINKYEKLRQNAEHKEEKLKKQQMEKKAELGQYSLQVRVLVQKNKELEDELVNSTKQKDSISQKYNKLKKQFQEVVQKIEKLEKDKYSLEQSKVKQNSQIIRLKNQIEKLKKQVKLGDERYAYQCQTSNMEKEKMKNDVIIQVEELANLNRKQSTDLTSLTAQLTEEKQKSSFLERKNAELQNSLDRLTQAMEDIKGVIDRLEEEKNDLENVKNTLEEQRKKSRNEAEKYKVEAQKMRKVEAQYMQACSVNEELVKKNFQNECELEELRKKVEQEMMEKTSQKVQISEGFEEQVKKLKEEIVKKDFMIKQLQNKVKILQEELRNADKLYENQKVKMNIKIRELEELLKERYEYTSRLSQPASSK